MKIKAWLNKYCFFLVLVLSLVLIDVFLADFVPRYARTSGRFSLNDFEIVQRDHPEEVWDKVFFGNSIAISSYLEEESTSGYINLGLDYGVVTDLWEMLEGGHITVGSELVIALNDFTLLDDFDTNPSYPWHQQQYEPYIYFARDRLKVLTEQTLAQVLAWQEPPYGKYSEQQRGTYYASMSDKDLKARMESESYREYLERPIEAYERNFSDLQKIADFCAERGIRLRILWTDINPSVEPWPSYLATREKTLDFCKENGIEVLDMYGTLDVECFHDDGHLNREYGSFVFTEEVDKWLNS